MTLGLFLMSNSVVSRFQLGKRFPHSCASVIILSQFKQGYEKKYNILVTLGLFIMILGFFLMYNSVVLRFQLDKRLVHFCSSVIPHFISSRAWEVGIESQ